MDTHGAHRPVLLEEALAALRIAPEGRYVDGTFGRGGHAAAILERLGGSGQLLAVDRDPEAVAAARARFGSDPRFAIEQGSFAMVEEMVARRGWTGEVNGILLDLGLSSPQLDDPARGFSFRQEGPLDMRMDPESDRSAAEWIAEAGEAEIVSVLHEYGEERFARRIAAAIVRARQETPIRTTRQLAGVVARAQPRRDPHKDPATRTFQAIRIHINRELEALDALLDQTERVLAPGGRLAVISFHSLEDRRVKRFIRRAERGAELPPDLPVREAERPQPRLRAIGRPIRAGAEEVAQNPRARSAILRVAERAA